MGLSPVSVLECCLGFICLSYLEPPEALVLQGSLMAAWEHFAGSKSCGTRSSPCPCSDLEVGSPALLQARAAWLPGKALPQQLPDPAAWLPGLEAGEGEEGLLTCL